MYRIKGERDGKRGSEGVCGIKEERKGGMKRWEDKCVSERCVGKSEEMCSGELEAGNRGERTERKTKQYG